MDTTEIKEVFTALVKGEVGSRKNEDSSELPGVL
jgi:hypothetical protein